MVMGDLEEGLDVAVIGAGPGGYVAAIRAAQLGRDVTLIDGAKRLGGICLREGCIPSKALIHVADVYKGIEEAADFGITVEGRKIDIAQMQEWKSGIIKKLSRGIEQLCKENKVSVICGKAHFTSPNSLQVETEAGMSSYQFNHAIIATGSEAIEIPSLPFNFEKNIIGSKGALNLEKVPQQLAVVGGGYIGIELGTVYAKLGSRVTIIEATDSLLPGMDSDIIKVVSRRLKKLSVTVLLETTANKYDKGTLTTSGPKVEADCVIVAVGRKPFSKGLNLEQAGVRVDDKGFIIVNKQQQTSQPTIYAIGDIVGGAMLAHKASAEGKIAAEAICGQPSAFDNVVPAVVFSDPEIATVGMTQADAEQRGLNVVVSQFPFAALGKSLAMNATDGFVKIVASADTKQVLGVHMVGGMCSELIAEATLAVEMGAHADDIALTIHTHPTFAEAMAEAADMLYGHAVHLTPRKQTK